MFKKTMTELKKIKIDIKIDETDYKSILWLDAEGPLKFKLQPKNIDPEVPVSGAHLFRDRPDQNHYDVWINGVKRIDKSKNNEFPFEFKDNAVMLRRK